MATWFPINQTVIQYVDSAGTPYSGAVLKCYKAGTSTVTNMATDAAGSNQQTSIALNASGFPEVSGSVVVPHISEDYKVSLYPTQAAADSNTGALWTVDNIQFQTRSTDQTNVSTGDDIQAKFDAAEAAGQDVWVEPGASFTVTELEFPAGVQVFMNKSTLNHPGGSNVKAVVTSIPTTTVVYDMIVDGTLTKSGSGLNQNGDGTINGTNDGLVQLSNESPTLINCEIRQSSGSGLVMSSPTAGMCITGLSVHDCDRNGINITAPQRGLLDVKECYECEYNGVYVDGGSSNYDAKEFVIRGSVWDIGNTSGTTYDQNFTGQNGNGFNTYRLNNFICEPIATNCEYSGFRANACDNFVVNSPRIRNASRCVGEDVNFFVEYGCLGCTINNPQIISDRGTGIAVVNQISNGTRDCVINGGYIKARQGIVTEGDTTITGTIIDAQLFGIRQGLNGFCKNLTTTGVLIRDTQGTPTLKHGISVDAMPLSGPSASQENVEITGCVIRDAITKIGVQRNRNMSTQPYISITGTTGTFTRGEVITGGTSGATARISPTNLTMNINAVASGPYTVGETVTGGVSGATGTVECVLWDASNSEAVIGINLTSGTFFDETVTGGTSGATGRLKITEDVNVGERTYNNASLLTLFNDRKGGTASNAFQTSISGTFVAGETITGSSSGATATVSFYEPSQNYPFPSNYVKAYGFEGIADDDNVESWIQDHQAYVSYADAPSTNRDRFIAVGELPKDGANEPFTATKKDVRDLFVEAEGGIQVASLHGRKQWILSNNGGKLINQTSFGGVMDNFTIRVFDATSKWIVAVNVDGVGFTSGTYYGRMMGGFSESLPYRTNYLYKSYRMTTADVCGTLALTGVSGTYQVGETVTGGTSSATGEITVISGSTLTVKFVSGTFTASETVTGGTSSATGTVSTYTAPTYTDDTPNWTITETGAPGAIVESGDLTLLTGNQTYTFAHGLGARPREMWMVLRCVTADLNYSVGDEVIIHPLYDGASSDGIILVADSTNIAAVQKTGINLINKTTYAFAAPTYSNWVGRIRARL